jgi:RHS repeat-associated protein
LRWNAYGKVQSVSKEDLENHPLGETMTFGYDAQQNRLKKEVKTGAKQKINYYFRDAQGNGLSLYRKSVIFERGESFFFCEEQTLYGSARLGTESVEHSMRGLVSSDGLTDEITRAREQHGDDWQQRLDEQYEGRFYERLQDAWGNEWSTRLDLLLQGSTDGWLIEQIRNESYTLQAGTKRYELSNHLGNVLAVVSDKKAQTDGVTWSAVVLSATDFFPFGMAMPGRSTDAKHRYGFNGKETDPETGIQDYGMRWYLPNLGRFPSVDPITKKYPELTPYQFAGNTPIQAIDLDGLEPALVALLKYTTTSTHYGVYTKY